MELSKEEKEAIETVESFKNLKWYEHAFDKGTEVLAEDEKQDIDIVLELISKLQKENEKQGKVIDLLVDEFLEIKMCRRKKLKREKKRNI